MRAPTSRLALWLIPLLLLTASSCGGGSEGDSGGVAATLELDAAYSEPFSFLSSVRELPDGRLLAADPLSQVLLRVDMDSQTADTLGRVGGGPGEYRQPDQVFPLPGDSTLLVDIGKTQLTVLGPDGSFHDGISMALPTEEGLPTIIFPRALDGQGDIYYTATGRMGDGPQDSIYVARYQRGAGAIDTVATLWRPEMKVERSGNSVRVMPTMMEPRDDWAVGTDGRVAVVRANGYVVEWHMPNGQVVTGPSTPYEPLPIREADKEANLDQTSGSGLMIGITQSSDGGTTMQMSRGGSMGGASSRTIADFQWAETFAPFQPDRSRVSPRNEVWVQRWLPADQPQRMDVFDTDGVRSGTVETPSGSQLLGFGHGPDNREVAYFARTDEVGLVWLERYRVVRGGAA